MIMFKLMGIVMIVFSSSMIGFFKSKSLVARHKKLQQIYDAVCVLYNHINQGDYELEKALENSLAKCGFLHVKNGEYICDDNDLTQDDKLIIKSFFSEIGSSVKSVECERINAFKLKIKSQLGFAQSDCHNKCKIYQTLGVCAGLVIGILLI